MQSFHLHNFPVASGNSSISQITYLAGELRKHVDDYEDPNPGYHTALEQAL